LERDRWHRGMTVAVVVALLLGLAGTGIGIEALRRTPSNAGPATSIAVPSGGATVSGVQGLVAVAIGPNLTAVDFLATGGTLHGSKIATGAPTIIGWTGKWDTTTVANGTYTLQSVGYDAGGKTAAGSNVTVTVKN
jgi:hypothetical protein